MCGVVGFLAHDNDEAQSTETLRQMMGAIRHRGPDANDVWVDSVAGLFLGHVRLSVLDLSSAGSQPMVAPSGRYVLSYNGEVYNHLEIRDALESEEPVDWRGTSDTETIVVAIERWGLNETLAKAKGMFALAVWDREEKELLLARDRMGEKPLCYALQGTRLFFASEVRAVEAHPLFQRTVDRESLELLTRYTYIPAPFTIYEGLRKVLPGQVVSFRPGRGLQEWYYWDAQQVVQRKARGASPRSEREAVDGLERVLKEAVASQMVADVPVGAFLSGGIDSSTIVSMMAAQSPGRVKTFSIGFHQEGYDEAGFAKRVAEHLGTDHTELYVSDAAAREVIPDLSSIYDEPFADSSQIPTVLVSRLARKEVTVALSGDGGDELFGGYYRHFTSEKLGQGMSRIPPVIRPFLAKAAGSFETRALAGRDWGRLRKLLKLVSQPDAYGLFRAFADHWPDSPVRRVERGRQFADRGADLGDLVSELMFFDQQLYLPDDILCKVDRAAMSTSLETRVPFLDIDVVEYAAGLSRENKMRDGQGKLPVRALLARYVPPSLFERPKMGFGVPLAAWLRGPLRDWAETLLDAALLNRQGFFHTPMVRRRWEQHLTGSRDWHTELWSVLMFQAWLSARPGVA